MIEIGINMCELRFLKDLLHAQLFLKEVVYNLRLQFRALETGGHRGTCPQYFEQLVAVPLQSFRKISGLTKWVPPQYLTPSDVPAVYFKLPI